MTRPSALFSLLFLLWDSSILLSQATSKLPPAIRALGPVVATAKDSFGRVLTVRGQSTGDVFVNDPMQRRLVRYDAALQHPLVIADSLTPTGSPYGRVAGLMPYRGDSSLFIDPFTLSMFVVDPAGKLGRVLSVPDANNVMALAALQGSSGTDPQGRLVYMNVGGSADSRSLTVRSPVLQSPDSSAILRADLVTRRIDTVAFVKISKRVRRFTEDSDGRRTVVSEINPLPIVDDWVLLPDGVVAIVRGRDYHVDFIALDGKRQSASKMPLAWQRLSDEDKAAFIDSVTAARNRIEARSTTSAATISESKATPRAPAAAVGSPASTPPAAARANGSPMTAPVVFVAPSELPDYKPAFFENATQADAQGNLWIATIPTVVRAGGQVYDVVNRRGELIDRVQVPANRSIIGFTGSDRAVLVVRSSPMTPRVTLEVARLR